MNNFFKTKKEEEKFRTSFYFRSCLFYKHGHKVHPWREYRAELVNPLIDLPLEHWAKLNDKLMNEQELVNSTKKLLEGFFFQKEILKSEIILECQSWRSLTSVWNNSRFSFCFPLALTLRVKDYKMLNLDETKFNINHSFDELEIKIKKTQREWTVLYNNYCDLHPRLKQTFWDEF